MERLSHQVNFEQDTQCFEREKGTRAAHICLKLGHIAMRFAEIERVPRYENGERENDVEHSYMLALVAPEIAKALELDLDAGQISQYAVVHDLIELKTGDVPTFLFDHHDQHQKEQQEQLAMQELISTLPPHTLMTLQNYELQEDAEARFVRYVDKLLPIVIDIIGQGERVMREDYNITSKEALIQCQAALHTRLVKQFGDEFPELDLAHKILCELFETTYRAPQLANILPKQAIPLTVT